MKEAIMWAMVDPNGNIMDGTAMMKQKDTIYNGAVWGRCGDNRTWKDFKKEGYCVIKVSVKELRQGKDGE